jgi:hypothetical protein
MAQRASRSLSRGAKTSRLSRRSQAVVLRRRLSDAAVVSGALRGGTRRVAPLPAARDFDRRRRAPGAPYGGVPACRCPWPTSPPPTRPSPRPQAFAAPRERLNVHAEALIGAGAQT